MMISLINNRPIVVVGTYPPIISLPSLENSNENTQKLWSVGSKRNGIISFVCGVDTVVSSFSLIR